MSNLCQTYISNDRIYACMTCGAHLAKHEDILSKAFTGRHGRAFLFKSVENMRMGAKEDRVLLTGLHTVADIQCNICQTTVGWKYIYAFEESQKYKESTYIVEKSKVSKDNGWD